MNKKGAGHVEFVISLVLFMVVVSGAVYFLSPTKSTTTIESSLGYTFNEVRGYSSINIRTYSVKVNPSGLSGGSVSVPIIVSGGESAIVKNQKGEEISSGSDSSKVCFNYAESSYGTGYFATILIGEDFTPAKKTLSCPLEVLGTYEISSSSEREIISETKLIDLQEKYEGNGYLDLKNDFNLRGNEFAFSVAFLDGETPDEISVQKNIPSGLEVFSQSRRVEILREDGSTEFAELIVWVW